MVRFVGGELFLFSVQTTCGAHPAAYSVGTGVISSRVKRPGLGNDRSPALSAKVMNEWIYTSISPVCLSSVHRNNCCLIVECGWFAGNCRGHVWQTNYRK
jgi:hypothetical protein